MKFKSPLLALAISACVALSTPVAADSWEPDGPLTIQIGFAAGGSTDTMGRVLANVMEENTGWNIAGANQARLSYAPDVKTFTESGVAAYVDPIFLLAMTGDTDPEAVKAIATALDEAIAAPDFIEIVESAVKGAPINMGIEGTHQMMTDGLENAQVLFAK
ncbi:MAG: hypothetical protein AB8B64_06690 [Granulosicoccus sp.]